MYTYPYENRLLADMEGEIWKPVKGYELFYLVSNFGRVKRLPRIKYYTDGRKYFMDKNIVRQTAKYRLNKYTNETRCAGIGVLFSIEGVSTHLHTSCLVYEAFIGKIPEKGIVQHKDDDPHNNRVENLYLYTRSQLTHKLHEQGRSNLLSSCLGVKHSTERISRHIASRIKEVSQYDLQGNKIATYKSLKEAEENTGISRNTISQAISGTIYRAGGFVWRTEKKNRIDLSEVRQKIFLSTANNCHPVCQYTAKGKWIATYRSISEASRVSGISAYNIYKSIKNNSAIQVDQAGYIWRCKEETGI